jgi:hypothetical protein
MTFEVVLIIGAGLERSLLRLFEDEARRIEGDNSR